MVLAVDTSDQKRFLIKRSQLTTWKLFVEFYLPEYQAMLDTYRRGPYPVVSLKDASVRIFGGPFGSDRKVDMYQESGIPYLRVKDVLTDGIVRNGLMYISPEKHRELIRSRVLPGNVLITVAGRLGTAAVFPEDLKEGNITGHIAGIELRAEINPYYLAIALNSSFGEIQVKRLGHRTTRPELNLTEVGHILIPLPPRRVQDQIAEIMRNAYAVRQDKLTEAHDLITTMDDWALGLLNLSYIEERHLPVFMIPNNSFHARRWDVLYHMPANNSLRNDGWCELEQHIEVRRETFTPSKQLNREYYYVGIEDMGNDPFSTDENAIALNGEKINGIRQWFRGGDILLARLGPCLINKKSAIVPNSVDIGCGSPEFLVISPKTGVDGGFVLWIVKSDYGLHQMVKKMRGATPSRMRLYDIDLLEMRVPNATAEQQVIIGKELQNRRARVKLLRAEADDVVENAKMQVERMILGQN